MTDGQIAYLEYLKSEHWRVLRRAVIHRDGMKCVRCPARVRLQAHHKFYRDRFEDSIPDDLITLCRTCHRAEHGIVRKLTIWMPVYLGDHMSETDGFNNAEHGAYMLCQFHYWRNGPMTTQLLKSIAKRQFGAVSEKFSFDGTVWRHARLDRLISDSKK